MHFILARPLRSLSSAVGYTATFPLLGLLLFRLRRSRPVLSAIYSLPRRRRRRKTEYPRGYVLVASASKSEGGKETRKLLSRCTFPQPSPSMPPKRPHPRRSSLLRRKGHFQFKFVFARQLRELFTGSVSRNDQRKAFMY